MSSVQSKGREGAALGGCKVHNWRFAHITLNVLQGASRSKPALDGLRKQCMLQGGGSEHHTVPKLGLRAWACLSAGATQKK